MATTELTKSANAGGWKATLSQSSVQLGAGQSVVVKLTVTAPSKASTFSVTVTGTSQADSSKSDSSVAETTSKK